MDTKVEDHIQLARHDYKKQQNKIWINIINQSKYACQSELYEEEKKQMFTYVNNFITKISIEKERLSDSRLKGSVIEKRKSHLRECMKSAFEIINQLKYLISMEKSIPPTMCDSVRNKTKHDTFRTNINWMETSIDSVVMRYNEIGKFLNLSSTELYTEIYKPMVHFKLNFISKKRKQEIERISKFKETQLILTDLRSPMELLASRIVDHGIAPTYRLLGINTSGGLTSYRYSCSLFGMYVEGNGKSKYSAKTNAAARMLRLFLKKQKCRNISSHVRAFNAKELNDISPLIKIKSDYVEILENTCVKNNYPSPIYTLISLTKRDYKLENNYSIRCDAMDFVAIAHSNKRSTATQISAKNILNLWGEMKK